MKLGNVEYIPGIWRNQWLLFGRNRLFFFSLYPVVKSIFHFLAPFKRLKSSNLALKYFSLDLRELFGPFDIVFAQPL